MGNNPQQQGKRPREDLEHPGPPPPKVGQNNKTSPDAESSPKDGGSSFKSSGDARGDNKSNDTGVKGAQPKILNESPPAEGEGSEDVKQHNREMDQRAERAYEQVSNEDAKKDKVPKKFWSGEYRIIRTWWNVSTPKFTDAS